MNCRVLFIQNECASEGGGAHSGRGAGAGERDGRAAAGAYSGEDVWSVHEKCMYYALFTSNASSFESIMSLALKTL